MQTEEANNIWIFEPNKYTILSINKVFDPLINLYYYNIFVFDEEDKKFKSPISSEDFIKKVNIFDRIIIKNILKKDTIFNKFIDIEFKIDNIGDRYISGYCNYMKQLIIIDKYKDKIVLIRPPYHIVVTNDNRIGSVFIEKPIDNNYRGEYQNIQISEKEFWMNVKSNDTVFIHHFIANAGRKYKAFIISEDTDKMYKLNILDEYNSELSNVMESIKYHNERCNDDYDE